jgi:secreted trypsin-like serine protease
MSQNQAPGNGNGGTCYGDSGGPNFWVEDDGTEVLVSVTSWGDVPCVATNITQRVDSPSVVSYLAGWLD